MNNIIVGSLPSFLVVVMLATTVTTATTIAAYTQTSTTPPPPTANQSLMAQNVTTSTTPPPIAPTANQSLMALVPTTIPLTQLRAEDPVFNNFITLADDCLNQYHDPAYNATNPTPATVCFQVIGEAITKWCGLEEHHADKCFLAERAQQAYVVLSTRAQQ
jgi:hypothetical protein